MPPAVDSCTPCAPPMGCSKRVSKRVLVIGSENLSRWVYWTDRDMAVLLADGAGAAVLEYDPTENDILSFVARCRRRRRGPFDLRTRRLYPDGRQRSLSPPCASWWIPQKRPMAPGERHLRRSQLGDSHQANIRIIQAACQRLNIDMDRAIISLDRYGNTSSASIPLAFDDARKADRIHKGDYALLTGFGAGMTWASAVVRWSK